MNIGHVSGGTNAGWRKVKIQAKTDWKCPSCAARNRYYWAACPACGHPRDQH